MLFTVDDAKKIVVEKSNVNRETYKEILELCYRRIRSKINADKKSREVVFVLPPFIVGKPVYNKDHAVRYIVGKLKHGGFKAVPENDNCSIRITWSSK
jgi:hypothetical protein